MCGVVRTDRSPSDIIVVPQEAAAMPPSITLGSDPPNASSAPIEGPCQPMQPIGAVSNKEIPTIDLATDENDDLQKAIALSLQEQQEQSLRDSSSRSTVEILIPQDRKRQGNTPVGLKNIGNSCWFNVVIQPLFHIPAFREMILRYPKQVEDINVDIKYQDRHLIPTLRVLFSLLVASEKKYIDPTDAVMLFQGQDMRKNTQQDVCEFIHKLLEKLEEECAALLKQKDVEKESSECLNSKESDFKNPIMKLFYGQSKKENNEIDDGPKCETFGQYPLTVKEYKDIHESILASMAGGVSVESLEVVEPVEQDTWFKMLPPVLIFSLSRYEYSKEKQRAEKVHNKFDFPQYLFMDRYMESNKDVVKEKHVKVAKLKQELKSLYSSLEKYQKFGSGEGKYPLVDILKYTLEFAESRTAKIEEKDIGLQFAMDIDSADNHEIDVEMLEEKEKFSDEQFTSNISKDNFIREYPSRESNCHISPQKKMRILPPVPLTYLPGELPVLQTCLPRWQKEVEIQVKQLQKSIDCLEDQLKTMYDEPELQCIPYKLHAVVVHEGQASGGHYWVYIYDNNADIWMKFNDMQVTECNWQEILLDGVGGQNNASAYCLMYIDQTRYECLFSDCKKSLGNSFSELPLDLQEYVKNDNLCFAKEIQEWEAAQTVDSAVPATAPNSPENYSQFSEVWVDEEEVGFFVECETLLSHNLKGVFENKDFMKNRDNSGWFQHILSNEITKLRVHANQAPDAHSEPSILDLGIYLIKNKQENFLYWYVCEMLWHLSHQYQPNDLVNFVRKEVKVQLQLLKEKNSVPSCKAYQGWKKHYQTFVKCTWYFICGYRKLISRNYEISLNYLMHALVLHQELKEPPKGPNKTLDYNILCHVFRVCLRSLSDKLLDAFISSTNEEKDRDIVQTFNKVVMPALSYINNSSIPEDAGLVSHIKDRYFKCLDTTPPNKSELIGQIVSGLINNSSEVEKLPSVNISAPPSVLSMFKEYKDILIPSTTREKTTAQTSDL